MDKKVKLLFGIHMHQPADNFKEAVDEAVEKCYKPFFQTVKKFPFFKFSLHCSGWLLEQIRKHHEEVFDDIQTLNRRGSIEFFTAGFYEPVLCAIPERDRKAQINQLNKVITKYFEQTPKGLWLTERVWEDGIVSGLSECGISYVMVDDYHFKASGFDEEMLDGYSFTENNGEKISLFPISRTLRYALPFKEVEAALEAVRNSAGNGGAAIVFDDAEKFGLWPQTHEWVYEKGWLEAFLHALEKDKNIESLHFGEYYASEKAKGLVYLDNVSYEEMGEWSMKAQDALKLEAIKTEVSKTYLDADKFVKGAFWKNFFVKYEESNRLHKRMIELSKHQVDTKKYLDALYRLQTNDVFWHGIFGGLYLPNLRDNAYSYLCECENIRYHKVKHRIEAADTDMDGYDEIKIVTKHFIVRFDSRQGGQMVEFLQRDSKFNYQNTLTRREEAYHQALLKEAPTTAQESRKEIATIHTLKTEADSSIREALYFDWYVKNSFIDHISDSSLTLENFRKCRFKEYGDFADQPFGYTVDDTKLTFRRDGGIYEDKTYETSVAKSYICDAETIHFSVELATKSPKHYLYGLEFNQHYADLGHVLLNGERLSEERTFEGIRDFSLWDGYTRKEIIFTLDHPCTLLAVPLCTVSKSEKGFDLMVQGVSFILLFPFSEYLNLQGSLEVKDV